jgi:hypothetical protein
MGAEPPPRSATAAAAATTALILAFAIIVALVVTSALAGYRITQVEGLDVVRCDQELREVLVGVRGVVVVTDEAGTVKLVLSKKGPFRNISDIDPRPGGGYLVAEADTHRLYFFDREGRLERWLQLETHAWFDVLPMDDGQLLIADTNGHRILVIRDDDGTVVAEQEDCGWANAPFRWGDDRYGVMCNRTSSFRFFDSRLEPQEAPRGSVLAEFNVAPSSGEFELAWDSRGSLYYVTSTASWMARFDEGAREPVLIANLRDAPLPTTDWSRQLRTLNGMCVTSADQVIVSSNSFTNLLVISDGQGGRPGRPDDGVEGLTEDALAEGTYLSIDNHIALFGDEQLRERISSVARERQRLDRQEAYGRQGLYVMLALLLMAYGADRFLGGRRGREPLLAAMGRRAQVIYDEIIRPELGALAGYIVLVLAAFGGGTLIGGRLGGLGLSVVTGLVAARTIGRRFAGGMLVHQRSTSLAARAVDLHIGSRAPHTPVLEPGEHVVVAGYRMPDDARKPRDDADFHEYASDVAGVPEDPTDLLDVLSPALQMIVVTDRRVIRYACDLVGRPRGPIHVRRRAGADQASVLCQRCGAAVTADRRCTHQRLLTGPAFAASCVLPGTGHLVLGEFGRGRLLLMVFGAAALELAEMLILISEDQIDFTSLQLARVAAGPALLWLFALYDLRRTIRIRRQEGAELAAVEAPPAGEPTAAPESPSDVIQRLGGTADARQVVEYYRSMVGTPAAAELTERAYLAVVRGCERANEPQLLVRAASALMAAHPKSALIPGVLWSVARIQRAAGRPELAEKTLRTIVEQYPDDPVAENARTSLRTQRTRDP